jgi:hypothetical protein
MSSDEGKSDALASALLAAGLAGSRGIEELESRVIENKPEYPVRRSSFRGQNRVQPSREVSSWARSQLRDLASDRETSNP